jgi:hypothetical protein
MTPEERFVKRVTGSIEELALFFVNEPDETKVVAALSETRQNLATELTGTFGAEGAAQFADRFVTTVIGRRRELLSN